MIFKNETPVRLFFGNRKPASLYRGCRKIASPCISEGEGTSFSVSHTYRAAPVSLTISGTSTLDALPTKENPDSTVSDTVMPVLTVGDTSFAVPYTLRSVHTYLREGSSTADLGILRRDTVTLSEGKVLYTKRVAKIPLTADLGWTVSTSGSLWSANDCGFLYTASSAFPDQLFCDKIPCTDAVTAMYPADSGGFSVAVSQGVRRVDVPRSLIGALSTDSPEVCLSLFKAWLTSTCPTLYVGTPDSITDITATDFGQAMLALETVYPETGFSVSDGHLSAEVLTAS